MNIKEIIQKYDEMFQKNSIDEIETYLSEQITTAVREEDDGALITLLNELVGFMRDTFQKEKAMLYCRELKKLIVSMGLTGTEAEATSYQNIANAYRAFGNYDESLEYFKKVEESYQRFLDEGDYRYASLYNNWGLLYQEMNNMPAAVEVQKKALLIIEAMEEYVEARATTRINLANSLLQLCEKNKKIKQDIWVEQLAEARKYTEDALSLFEVDGGRDFHYSAALATMADIYVIEENDICAAEFYEKSLLDMEKHLGKNENYLRVFEKYRKVLERNPEIKWKSNLERSEAFYNDYGKKMIQEQFPQYSDRIAVGIVGEGSDCYGFDDYISADHDYGLGFLMWLTESDYELFGKELEDAYSHLLKEHALDLKKNNFLEQRRGVKTINEFYGNILGVQGNFEEEANFSLEGISEYRLSQAVNGKVFVDQMGVFTKVRNRLWEYYDEPLWLKKIAVEMHDFSAYAQSNYPRAMARMDYVTASICVVKAMESAMNLIYLLNRKYAPYDKWKVKGLEGISVLNEMLDIIKRIPFIGNQASAWQNVIFQSGLVNTKDEYVVAFEALASSILDELRKQKIVEGDSLFLEKYVPGLMTESVHKGMVEKIVALEWKQFDGVINEGGRASCQNDYPTFSIMRKSQYLTWNNDLLNSYYHDLELAEKKGWNLIMEKYARMMESTSREQFDSLKDQLPERSQQRIAIQEEIIKIQIGWMEDFAAKYPNMAGNARSIHSFEDTKDNTSYETYLRGELGTYGDETIELYGRMIVSYVNEAKNLAYEIMNNTAELYGYATVEEAEQRMG